jgi:hypothetical protein
VAYQREPWRAKAVGEDDPARHSRAFDPLETHHDLAKEMLRRFGYDPRESAAVADLVRRAANAELSGIVSAWVREALRPLPKPPQIPNWISDALEGGGDLSFPIIETLPDDASFVTRREIIPLQDIPEDVSKGWTEFRRRFAYADQLLQPEPENARRWSWKVRGRPGRSRPPDYGSDALAKAFVRRLVIEGRRRGPVRPMEATLLAAFVGVEELPIRTAKVLELRRLCWRDRLRRMRARRAEN